MILKLERWWAAKGDSLLRAATFLCLGIAAIWLGYQFWRLCIQPLPTGAVDLMLRYREVVGWFDGKPIYSHNDNAVYPPASYLMLAPLSWLALPAARWCFAIASAFLLALVTRGFANHCGAGSATAGSTRHRRFLLLLPLALYPFGAGIGNGQLSLPVLACLMLTFALIGDGEKSLARDVLITCAFLVALIKPSIAVFFFWIVLLTQGGLRRGALVVSAYAALTFISSMFQKPGPVQLVEAWSRRATAGAQWGATRGGGSIRRTGGRTREAGEALPDRSDAHGTGGDVSPHATAPADATNSGTAVDPLSDPGPPIEILHVNLQSVLSALDLKEWVLPAILFLLVGLALWVLLHRRCSVWILAGVTAIVARSAMYHGWYDDVILLLPLIALYHATGPLFPARGRVVAGFFFGLFAASLLAPGGVYLLPHPWNNIYVLAQTGVLFLVLGFLVWLARQSRDPLSLPQ